MSASFSAGGFQVLDVDPSTRQTYDGYIRKHIRRTLGSVTLTRLETLDSSTLSFADDGSTATAGHTCNTGPAGRTAAMSMRRLAASHPTPLDATHAGGLASPHVCRGLADSTVRQMHWIISGAIDRAVVWQWISVSPAEHANKPALPHPDPKPPAAEEAARLVECAWLEARTEVRSCGSP